MLFDLDTSKGVVQLLAAVRVSDLSSAEKNELRDLVMVYANSHEQSIKITLEQKIATHKLEPVVQTKAAESPGNQYPFGTTRPSPTVKPPQVPAVNVTTPVPTESVEQSGSSDGQPIAEQESSTPEAPAVALPASAPAAKTITSSVPLDGESKQSHASDAPVPIPSQPNTSPTVVPGEAKKLEEPSATTTQDATQAVAVSESKSTPPPIPSVSASVRGAGDELARIKEIKADVNARSGNPANLIDITNGAGREYMSALLDAMKALNSGASPVPAMERLETAYEAVTVALDAPKNQTETTKNSPPTAHPVAHADTSQTVNVKVDSNSAPDEPVPVPPSTKLANEPKQVAQTESTSENNISKDAAADPQPTPADPVPLDVSAPPPINLPTLADQSPGKPVPPAPRGPRSVAEATATPSPIDPPRIPTVHGENNLPKSHHAVSLAETHTQPHSLSDVPDAASLETASVSGDPLYTQEVDSGLNQLLEEWPLFKKSGLFGTGPKGREHPLFLKIQGLQIPALLAGRFEGATQDVRQSITDYMNGWRYEQGIVYEQGETFEHYLRRVIRHIIDVQKS